MTTEITTSRPTAATVPPAPGAAPSSSPTSSSPEPAPEQRRHVRGARQTDVFALVGAMASAAGLTWLLFTQLAPFSGAMGWVVVWATFFLVVYAVLVSFDESGQAVRDRIAAAVLHMLAVTLLAGLVLVVVYVVARGVPALVHPNFYVKDLSVTGPLEPLSSGGVLHGVAGTLIEITMALVVTIPVGLTCAVFLTEFPSPFARLVRTLVEAMTALPSVVAGLFVYSTAILLLHLPPSGLAASLAMSVMMLPIIIRASDVVLRLVPGSLTEASLALGSSRWRTVWYVTLPTARSGLATAVILGTARGIGETSPVLLTAGFGANLNVNPLSGPMVSLPLLAYELRKIPEDAMIARGFGAAALLMIIVLVLFVVARTLGGRGAGVLTPRKQRQVVRDSRRDAERIAGVARARAAEAREAGPTVLPDTTPVPSPEERKS